MAIFDGKTERNGKWKRNANMDKLQMNLGWKYPSNNRTFKETPKMNKHGQYEPHKAL